MGSTHELSAVWAQRYCADGLSGNFVQPTLFKTPKVPAYIRYMVVLGNADDCERIARKHVKKPEIYQVGSLYNLFSKFKAKVCSNPTTDGFLPQRYINE